MLVIIKGAGDIASGIAIRLFRSKIKVIMTDLPKPTAIRRTVCFSQAIVNGRAQVEDVVSVCAENVQQALSLADSGVIPVLADEDAVCIKEIHPDIVIDAILAKKNLGTKITDAPVVIGIGPGFTVGKDCHAIIETQRGHYLGRVILSGSAAENTGVPGNIGGYTTERIIRAVRDGIFLQNAEIGDIVEVGQTVAFVDGEAVKCSIGGVLRGILPSGTPVFKGMKSGDVDPRGRKEYCNSVSDKALSVGGGALEACLRLYKGEQR